MSDILIDPKPAVTLEQIGGYLREEFTLAVKASECKDFTAREYLIVAVEAAAIAGLWFFMMKGRKVAKSGPDPEFDAFYEALRAEVLAS